VDALKNNKTPLLKGFNRVGMTGFEPATTRPPAVFNTQYSNFNKIILITRILWWSSLSWAKTKGHIPIKQLVPLCIF